jgi:CheY-like chemotaxis protein
MTTEPASSAEQQRKLRVLLVEDDADTLAATLRLLEAMGHWATGVRSAEAAIARFFEGAFDVVMVDIGLPALSGRDFAERLLRDHRVPVVFVTGQAEPAQTLPGTAWLRKPYTLEQTRRRRGPVVRRS